ncbi:MAG: choice-of-anchor X domain-containing protein [candidate division WOR-3 bacterium]
MSFLAILTTLELSQISGAGLSGTQEEQGVDIVMLMDESGSMKKLDPNRFADEAAKLLLDIARLFGKEARVAVVSYGDGARVLMPFTILDSAYTGIKKSIGKLDRNAPLTDINSGLEVTYDLLEKRDGLNQAFVVIMTDGEITERDIPQGTDIFAYKEKASRLAGNYNLRNWPIYTVAFTTGTTIYKDLARQTGGDYYEVKGPSEVPDAYLKVFEDFLLRFVRRYHPVQQGGQTEELVIDESISEITIVTGKKKGETVELIDPAGNPVEGERVKEKAYILIKVTKPMPGIWKVVFKDRGAVMYSIVIPKILKPADPELPIDEPVVVQVKLVPTEPGKPIFPQDFSGEAYLHYPDGRSESFMLYDDGKHDDGMPNDGILGRSYYSIPTEGDYHITVVIRHKKTGSEIRVKKALKITYKPKIVVSVENPGFIGEPMKVSAFVVNKGGRVFTRENYTVTATGPKFDVTTLTLLDNGTGGDERANDGRYTALFADTKEPGRYSFKVQGDFEVQPLKPGEAVRNFKEEANAYDEVWLSLGKVSTPGCLWFGELAGKTYEHRIQIYSYYPGKVMPNFYTFMVERQGKMGIGAAVPVIKTKTVPELEQGKPDFLKAEAQIPGSTPSGKYLVIASGMLQPLSKPVKANYEFKTSTTGKVFLTFFGFSVLIGGGVGLAYWLTTKD